MQFATSGQIVIYATKSFDVVALNTEIVGSYAIRDFCSLGAPKNRVGHKMAYLIRSPMDGYVS
jgi:hypothetical protein